MVTEQEEKIAAQIAKIKAQHQAAAEKEIEDFKLSFEVDSAKKELSNKFKTELKELDTQHKAELKELEAQQRNDIKEFEKKYNTVYELSNGKYLNTTDGKCETVAAMVDEFDRPKYSLNKDNQVINLKGEQIKSTIVFKDATGKKQTLAVSAFQSYLMNKKK